MKLRKVALLLGVVIMLSGCNGNDPLEVTPSQEQTTESVSEDISSEVESETEATVEVTEVFETETEIDTQGGGTEVIMDRKVHDITKSALLLDAQQGDRTNMMVSTLSLDVALGLAANGAMGDTLSQLEGYLEMPIDSYNDYVRGLLSDTSDEMHIANSVWVNDKYDITDQYASRVKESYGVEAESFDVTDSVGTAERINNWVLENTNSMIKELVMPQHITQETYSVLVNAVCFEDKWGTEFDEILEEMEFTNIDDSVSDVTMLVQDGEGVYYENDSLMAFVKEYRNDQYEFIGVLPKSEGDMFNKSISDLHIEELLSTDRKSSGNLTVMLPEFEFDYNVTGIVQTLMDNGVELPFMPIADFSDMTDADVSISDVIQKTKVKVDREGTQASAATGLIMTLDAAMPLEEEPVNIILDRPFVFMIYDKSANTIVFMGKVVKL